jgi:uncharacterized protein YjdB
VSRRARRSLPVLAAVIVVACSSTTTVNPPSGRAVIVARATSLAVGDTMTLVAGLKYSNGTFTPFLINHTIASLDTSIASVDSLSHLMRGKKAGTATIRVTIPPPTAASFDTSFTITP